MIGIYAIRNRKSKKTYIGQSTNIGSRWQKHIIHLESNKHANYMLQKDWNEYDHKDFSFVILEDLTLPLDMCFYDGNKLELGLICREYYYSKELDAFNNGYNIDHTFENVINGKFINTNNPEKLKKCMKRLLEICPDLLEKEFDKSNFFSYISLIENAKKSCNYISDNNKGTDTDDVLYGDTETDTVISSNEVITISKISKFLPVIFNNKYTTQVIYYAFIKMGFLYYENKENNYKWRANEKGIKSGYFYREITERTIRTYWTTLGIKKAIEVANNINDYIESDELTVANSRYEIEKGLNRMTIKRELYDKGALTQ